MASAVRKGGKKKTKAAKKEEVQHMNKTMELLYQQTVEGSTLCDVSLVIGDTVMKAHWCVLLTCPYFKDIHDKRKELPTDEVKLDYEDADAVKAAIRFLYTSKLKLSLNTLQHLLGAATYLKMEDLKQHGIQFLENVKLTLKNSAQVMAISKQHLPSTRRVHDRAERFVWGHLPQLMKGDTLLDISVDEIVAFFRNLTLTFVKQEEYFDFIVRWTEKDPEKRGDHFPRLFKSLNMLMVTERFLHDKVLSHPLVQQSGDCMLHCQDAQNRSSADFTPCGDAVMVDIIIMGGGAREKLIRSDEESIWHFESLKLHAYFPLEKRWVKLPELPYTIKKPLMTLTEDGKLLITDSNQSKKNKRSKEILSYSLLENKWTLIKFDFPEENTCYRFHSLLSSNGRVFIVASIKDSCDTPPPKRKKRVQIVTNEDTGPFRYVQLLELMSTSGTASLQVRSKVFQRSIKLEIRAVCSQKKDRTTLEGDFIYITGTECVDYTARSLAGSQTKLLVYNVKTDTCTHKNLEKNLTKTSLVFTLPEGLVCSDIGAETIQFFSQSEEKLVTTKDHAVPKPVCAGPCVMAKERQSYTCVGRNLYVFGGEEGPSWDASTAARYCFASKEWWFHGMMPDPVLDAGIARGRLSSDLLRCGPCCPHCKFEEERGVIYDLGGIDEDPDFEVGNVYHSTDSEIYMYDNSDFEAMIEDYDLMRYGDNLL